MKSLLHVAEKHDKPHKILLQMLGQLGGVRLGQIIEVFQAMCEACLITTNIPEQCTVAKLSKTLIKTLTAVIAPMELKVAITTDYRFPDEQFLTLYSSSSFGRFSKLFTPDEVQMFQKWLTYMFTESSKRGELDGTTAINMQIDGKRRPLHAETFLKKLVEDNIMVKLQTRDTYIFTMKSVMELESRLRSNNYDIPICPVCSVIIVAQRFSYTCESCDTSVHNSCLYKMVSLSKAPVSCPGQNRCQTKYNRNTLEELDFDENLPEAVNLPVEIRSSGVRAPKRAKMEAVTEDEDEEEEEVQDENMPMDVDDEDD